MELGVELIEQPLPAADVEGLRALREVRPRPALVVDEGCHDLRDVASAASWADGVNVKLAKSGGLREAVRMIHAARALGLRVMLGCMVESQLGVAAAAQVASLADWVDLDGHLLLASSPYEGLELRATAGAALERPWPRRPAGMSERLAILAEGLFESHHGKTAHGVIRYGAREVAAVIDSSCAGRTASEVIPFCARPVPIVASLGEALRHDPTTLLLGVAPTGRWLDPPGGRCCSRRSAPDSTSRPACITSSPTTPSCARPLPRTAPAFAICAHAS